MLTISTSKSIVAAILDYYMKYCLEGIDKVGQWLGAAASILGLWGIVVKRDTFKNLLEGFSPDRAVSLVQNAGHPHRQCCWDLTFSAPKSVSVIWALAPEQLRKQVESAHDMAVAVTLTLLQKLAGVTRRGKGGRTEERASLLFAVFREGTSRALDPQIHTHAVLINLAFREDGTTGTLHSMRFFELKKMFGKIYQNELAQNLRALGLVIEQEKVGFHVVGVPRDLCREYSHRRQQIEAWLKENGLEGAIAAKDAATATRPKKRDVPQADLFAAWQKVAHHFGWGPEQTAKLFQTPTQQRVVETRLTQETQHPDLLNRKQGRNDKRGIVQATSLIPSDERCDELLSRSRSKRSGRRALPFFRVEWHPLFDRTPWLRPKRRLLRIEWESVFPSFPWRRARNLKAPYLAISIPQIAVGPQQEFKPRWWTIRAKRELLLGEVRIQNRILFPNAPKWSPLHGLSLPALRVTARRSKWKPIDLDKKFDRSRSH